MAVNFYRIPLTNKPQDFTISLASVDYRVVCRWNPAVEGGWALDFYDNVTNEPIVMNIPLITGADLLEQYRYLGFVGSLFVLTDGDTEAVPTLDNLGGNSNLYFVVET